ncbi:MAG: hypothetical protein EOM19_05400 [Candidatus Moranbacteria bacterium]|nr:hypothetical protein [Candidatus Moranbacteria bacterium]
MYKEPLFQVDTNFQIGKDVDHWIEQQKKLEQTEGWEKLTERQQRMIRASFRVQNRAYRGTDEGSLFRIRSEKETLSIEEEITFLQRPKENKYHLSQNMISRMFCHLAVILIEKEMLPKKNVIRDRFFNERDSLSVKEWKEYFSVDWKEVGGIEEKIKGIGFPAVLYIDKFEQSELQYKNDSRLHALHSCIAMGENEGEILVWEKVSRRFPFNVTNLQTVLDRYPFITHCAVRSLGKNGET